MPVRPKVALVGAPKIPPPRTPRTPLPKALRRKCRTAALAAADWFVRSQVRMRKPYWDANDGRFLYNYHMPGKTPVLGINWTQARAAFVLLSAHAATGKREYLDAAARGAAYNNTLQILDRRDRKTFGALLEEVPRSTTISPRDATEAAEGYLMMYRQSGEADSLYRAEAYAKWHLAHGVIDGVPILNINLASGESNPGHQAFSCACAKTFNLFYDATGKRLYLSRGVVPPLRYLIDTFQCPDGSLEYTNGKTTYNDDGCGVALLGGYLRTGNRDFLDAALALGEWTLSLAPPFPRHCAFPSMACFLADLWRLAGDADYLDWITAHIDKWLFARQVLKTKDPFARGAFRGEDEPVDGYIPGTDPMDYVNTRNTCYAALACFKLAGKPWPVGYTAFA